MADNIKIFGNVFKHKLSPFFRYYFAQERDGVILLH